MGYYDSFIKKPESTTPAASPPAADGSIVPLKKTAPGTGYYDSFTKKPAAAPAAKGDDLAGQLGAGVVTGIPNTIAGLADIMESGTIGGVQRAMRYPGQMFDLARGVPEAEVARKEAEQQYKPVSGKAIKDTLSFMRLNPNDYFAEPKTAGERIARMGGEGLITGILPSGAGQVSGLAKLGVVAKELFAGLTGGLAAQTAMEVAPDEWDIPAGLVGGLAGGIGGGLAAELPGVAVRGAKKGAHFVAPALAPISKKVREGLAAESLASKATDPAAAIDALGQPREIVPGSMPTAAQAADDTGLRIYERALSRGDKDFREKLLERVEENNAARVAALDNIQREGDVGAAAQFFRDRMAQLEQRADELYDQAHSRAQKASDDLGDGRSAGEVGDQARGAVSAEFQRLNKEANTLWGAIDPDKSLHVESRPLVERAAGIYGRMSPEEQLSLSADEKALAGIIGDYEGPIQFERFKQLRTQLNEEMGKAKMSGQNRSYGRLAQLRGAIEDAIQESIEGKFARNASLADDFVRQAKEWYARSTDTGETGAGAGARAADAAPAGPGAVPGLVRAGRDPGVEPAAAARSEGLPEDADRGARRAVEGRSAFEQSDAKAFTRAELQARDEGDARVSRRVAGESTAAGSNQRPLDRAANEAATSPQNRLPEPTPAQRESGNYRKGHIKFGGLDISIENPAGSTRSGADRTGKPWSVDLKDHYGYIRGTVGKDKDHIDTFIKAGARDLDADSPVFVVDQIDPRTGRFDEHKVMLGYADRAAAEAAYKANYANDWKGMGEVTPTTLGQFKSWLKEADTKKPFKGTANEAPENLTGRAGDAGVRPVSRQPAQAARDGRREADGSLVGLPRKVGNHAASAYPDAQRVAENYMKKAGLEYRPPNTYARVEPERAKRVADAYEAMPHNPRDPKVRRAYKAMADETLAQYRAMLDDGVKIEFIRPGEPDPYNGNPRNMTEDVRNNKHMWVFSTRDGFGSDATFDVSENPLLADSGFTISGQPAVVNDIFRAVHDYFGHVKEGVGFRADGEENAWRAHSAMYSPEARKAMTTETRGQNSWVNYGPYGERNRTAKSEDTHYADQKIGILPDWAISEGAGDAPVKIADTLAKRFEDAGRPAAEAKATGVVVDSFYETMAKTLGKSVDDLLAEHPLPQVRKGGEGGEFFQSEPAPAAPFYSSALRAVETSKTGKASPQQWLATLKNTQGVKGEELEWIGLEPWLASQSGPVTREQVADFIRANQIEVEDVDLRGGATAAEAALPRRFDWEPDDIDEDYVRERAQERVVEEEQDYRDRVASKEDIEPEEVTQEQMEALAFEDEMRYREQEPDGYNTSISLDTPDGETVFYDLYRDRAGYTTILRDGHDVADGSHLDDDDIRSAISADFRKNFSKEAEGDGPTQYEEYTLPGGDDYHELLLRLPERSGRDDTRPSAEVQAKYKDEWDSSVARMNTASREYPPAGGPSPYDEAYAAQDALHAKMIEETRATQTPWKRGENFDAPHFNDAPPNILAHVRFKTRTSADGKKTLFLEEVQSDWHQKGREEGYKRNLSADEKSRLAELRNSANAASEAARVAKSDAARRASGGAHKSVSEIVDAIEDGRRAAGRHGVRMIDLIEAPSAERVARGDVPVPAMVERANADPEVQRGIKAYMARKVVNNDEALNRADEAARAAERAWNDLDGQRRNGVPDAPFKTSWPELAMKRMIRWAAQNGYDQIAWTPGKVQAERYGLATHVDNIEWKPFPGESNEMQVMIHPKQGRSVRLEVGPQGRVLHSPHPDWTGKHLSEVVGKDVADKIMSERQGEMGGNDLVIGGSGMRQFYDKMLPSIANKLGKKFGAQTAKVKIPVHEGFNGESIRVGADQHRVPGIEADAIPITKEMRDSAMQGQPLFQSTPKDPRGSIQFGSPETIISLFKGADASTAIHEAAHHFLHMYRSFADAVDTPKAIADDWRAAKTWWDKNANDVAKDGGDGITAADVRKVLREGTTGDVKKDVAVDRGLHEQWARGFETYLRDGTAPNSSLKAIFKQFKDWLTSIYTNATDLGVKLTPEIRQVFDNMLGAEAKGGPKMMDEAAAGRFKAASSATKNIKETFGAKPVKAMMRRQGATYPFEMPSESVTSNLWKPGPQGATNIKNVMKAAGSSSEAKDAIEAAAVMSLKAATGRDGIIDPKKFVDWRAKHADALREVPDLDKRMGSAAEAGKAVADISAKRKEALDTVRRTAIGKLLKVEDEADVSRAIGTMLNGAGAVKAMRELVAEAKADPEAMAGLQRAVVDHLTSKFRTPKDALSADAFQKYIGRNTPALSQVLDPEQINAIHAIAKDLKRATKDVRSPGGGSDTAENLGDRARFGIDQPSIWKALLQRAAAGAPGAVVGLLHSHIASLAGFLGGAVLQHMRAAGIKTVADLVHEAMLDPDLMRELLRKAPKKPGTGSAISLSRILANSARRAMVLGAGIDDEDRWLNRRASSPPPHKEARTGITPALGVRG